MREVLPVKMAKKKKNPSSYRLFRNQLNIYFQMVKAFYISFSNYSYGTEIEVLFKKKKKQGSALYSK